MFSRLKFKLGLTSSTFVLVLVAQAIAVYALRSEWNTVSPLLRVSVALAAVLQLLVVGFGYFFFARPVLPWLSRAKRLEVLRRFLEGELPKWFALFSRYLPLAMQIVQLFLAPQSAGRSKRAPKRRARATKSTLKAV